MERNFICDRALEYVLTRRVEELAELTVGKIARVLNVSRSYLARRFKRERNSSLEEYLSREKMFRSAFLLMNEPRLTIRQLSEKMGFLDSDYFARVFKKHFGISPGRYRDCKIGSISLYNRKKTDHRTEYPEKNEPAGWQE